MITKEMRDYFLMRTRAHLYLVHKYHNLIFKLIHRDLDFYSYPICADALDAHRDVHDQSKFQEPEYIPYVYITWMYKCRKEGVPFEIPEDIKNSMHDATFHHIKNNAHHPEFWDLDFTASDLNKDDRDRPTGGRLVDGTAMPMTYIAAMVADWCAMSEELGGHPKDWAKANINVRWSFSEQQVELIYALIEKIYTIKG